MTLMPYLGDVGVLRAVGDIGSLEDAHVLGAIHIDDVASLRDVSDPKVSYVYVAFLRCLR